MEIDKLRERLYELEEKKDSNHTTGYVSAILDLIESSGQLCETESCPFIEEKSRTSPYTKDKIIIEYCDYGEGDCWIEDVKREIIESDRWAVHKCSSCGGVMYHIGDYGIVYPMLVAHQYVCGECQYVEDNFEIFFEGVEQGIEHHPCGDL